MRRYLYLVGATFACGVAAWAEPTISPEGTWEGTCTRDNRTVNANVSIDRGGARMNGVGATAFSLNGPDVGFTVPGRHDTRFNGRFSSGTWNLKGSLTTQGKAADCAMNRKVDNSGRICVRNPEQYEIWWKLSPGNPSRPVRLAGGRQANGSTVSVGEGRLCWGRTAADANSCTRSTPQRAFSC